MNRCKRRLWDASKSELTTNSGLVTLSSKKIQKLKTEPAKSCYTSAIGNSGQEFSITDSSTVQSKDSRLYSSGDSIVKRPALPSSVYNVNCEHLARLLLGKCIVRELENGTHACGKIVETESYPGSTDMASHSYKGKTLRNAAMFMDPGTAYVYNIYGMYQCFNISSKGNGTAVLIRSLEPVEGTDAMRAHRLAKRRGKSNTPLKDTHLCNGPSKLCHAMDISKSQFDQHDLTKGISLWLVDGDHDIAQEDIVLTTRIGINGPGKERLARFYVRGNPCVSVRDKKAEHP